MKKIKKIGAAVCAAAVSVSMITAMPVNAKSLSGWGSISVKKYLTLESIAFVLSINL